MAERLHLICTYYVSFVQKNEFVPRIKKHIVTLVFYMDVDEGEDTEGDRKEFDININILIQQPFFRVIK